MQSTQIMIQLYKMSFQVCAQSVHTDCFRFTDNASHTLHRSLFPVHNITWSLRDLLNTGGVETRDAIPAIPHHIKDANWGENKVYRLF